MDEIYAAIAQLAQLLTETGTTGDGVAVASLFGRLANLGLTTDAASSNGNALQRLANLVAVVGQINDAGNAAGSVNAKVVDVKNYLANTIYAYETGTLQPGIGAQGDAALATGSANAKLAALLQRVGGGTPGFLYQNISIGTTATTILSISGTGILYYLAHSSNSFNSFIITVDGVQRFNITSAPNLSTAQPIPVLIGPLRFGTSLLVTATNASAGSGWFYGNYLTGVA